MAAACFDVMQSMPRMGIAGIGIIDAELHAILGDRDAAIESLRSAVNAGWALLLASAVRIQPQFRESQ